MKYVPLNARDRTYIDKPHWNWQFIRGVQRILNVTKGSVMTGEEFFYRAFGENEEEFLRILHMPEGILMSRGRTPGAEEKDWINKFDELIRAEKRELLSILCENRVKRSLVAVIRRNKNKKLKNILNYYLPESEGNDELTIWNEIHEAPPDEQSDEISTFI
jgi:hypothetical protein